MEYREQVFPEATGRYLGCNWASEASPTLGCSIEISGDIYVSVCLSCTKMRRWNYVRACSKSFLGGKN